MSGTRIIQIVAAIVMVACVTASGVLLPNLVQRSQNHVLRYTNVSVEGAPPIVALGTAIGALRGLIVDYLWIKVNIMKEKGLYYEVMADADMITKLQPRFAPVWAFHGHNMAYNISVATHTEQERWDWVNAGIRLVRSEGLRYNPNNLPLHRELAFWLAHKIEGVADDAHLYYKYMFCVEWHNLLGEPPTEYQARIAWIKDVADAPESEIAAEQRTPGVAALIQRLRDSAKQFGQGEYQFDRRFLERYTQWLSVKQRSAAAKILGVEERLRQTYPDFLAFDGIASDPAMTEQWKTLIAFARKKVLRDEYNMDPQLMYEYTRDLGPIDWRHGQAHALYWSRKGSFAGQGRLSDEDIYISLNNDSAQMQAMQDMARSGRISYDPFSNELPGRFPEPHWIDTIDRMFEPMYEKHRYVRGAGGERFITFLQNFMGSAIREWFRSGERERAQRLMDRLAYLFPNNRYNQKLEVFVERETYDQYQAQPHIAPSDIAASLRYGFKMGTIGNRPEVLRDAFEFAQKVTAWFKGNSWNDYETKFGTGRIKDIIGELEDSAEIAYLGLMVDGGLRLEDRMTIWNNTDHVESEVTRQPPVFRALVYDRAMPLIEQQFQNHELSQRTTFNEAFPPPPGLDSARQVLLRRQQQREQERQEAMERDEMTRRGGG